MAAAARGQRIRSILHNVVAGAAVVIVSVVAVVLALTATEASDGIDTGTGSPTACLTTSGADTVDNPAEAGSVKATAPSGQIINTICIKSGTETFALGGSGDCANDARQHSPCITANGLYGKNDCYTVGGMGTSSVTVTQKAGPCSAISHVDFITKDPETPTNTATATNTPPPGTPTPTPIGGVGRFLDAPGAPLNVSNSNHGRASLWAVLTGAVLVAFTVGAGLWCVKRRWLI